MMRSAISSFVFAWQLLLLPTPTLAAENDARQHPDSPQYIEAETTLNVSAHYIDKVFKDGLESLQLIATTPAARQGDWTNIKPYLSQLESSLPGVYFFVLPDGNYFTLTKDYTNLNLSNRPYFKPLFSGQPILGFPIYSRSSGKKSALLAAPIIADDKVVGALGASVFLDELHTKLNRDFSLPDDYTWFVLNAEGDTVLDRDSEFIFMNPLTQGSPSLREAVSEALTHEKGYTGYDLNGSRQALYRKLPTLNWWLFLTHIEGGTPPSPPQLKLSLDNFVPQLQQSLEAIDQSLARLMAQRLVDVDKENEVRALLTAVINENINVIDVAFVDANGFLRYIAPSDYKNFEMADISEQQHVQMMQQDPAPLLSSGFTSVEGFLAVDIARPLFDGNQQFTGAVSALIRPELLIEPLLHNSSIPADYELWVMQPDGLIIFDQDRQEIGKNLFTDPLYAGYESLRKLGREISASDNGEGSYVYVAPQSTDKVIKKAVWQTIKLHNQSWRIVLAYRPYEAR